MRLFKRLVMFFCHVYEPNECFSYGKLISFKNITYCEINTFEDNVDFCYCLLGVCFVGVITGITIIIVIIFW